MNEKTKHTHLDATASDLLAALQAIVPAYEAALERLCELGQGFGQVMSTRVLPAARDAITKAIGDPCELNDGTNRR